MRSYFTVARFNQVKLLNLGRGGLFGRCKLSVWVSPCFSYDHKHNESCNAATCKEVDNGVWFAFVAADLPFVTGSHKTMIRTWNAKVCGWQIP